MYLAFSNSDGDIVHREDIGRIYFDNTFERNKIIHELPLSIQNRLNQ